MRIVVSIKVVKYAKMAQNPLNLLLLATIIILAIGVFFFEINIELGPDEDCWE